MRALAVSAFAGATVHGALRRVDPWGALGARGGFAALAGKSDDVTVSTATVRGGWLGPAARVGVDGLLGARGTLGVHLELGWAVLGTRARIDGELGPGVAGLWVGGGVSLGLRWPSAMRRAQPATTVSMQAM